MPLYNEYNDADLAALIASGDQLAFTVLVERYTSVIYGHLVSYLKNGQEAEDITQDIFITLWKNRQQLPGILNLSAYLSATTRNRANNAFRNKLNTLAEPPADTIESVLVTPSDHLEYRELYNVLMSGIAELPPRRKQVFTMSRITGLSYDEIAVSLGISRSAVKQHIIEAMLFLRKHLKSRMEMAVPIFIIFFSAK
ncbi:MAG: sigma-70 family RNA polymerase sigma factor [Chitinophagaceae bacterium]|nr:sigma-70 family RNA polymerase sigma factor [Chitinophagaceae bacterium]